MQDVQTIQGLNLESPTTLIKINNIDKNENLLKLLKTIKNFHPIFIENFKIENNTLTISSKLPALWRDSTETFRKLSKNEITYTEAKEYIINTVIKRKVKSMSTIPLLYRAHQLGYETTLTIAEEGLIAGVSEGYGYKWNRYYTIGCGAGSQVTCSISSSKDSTFGKNIQEDKWRTNKLIERMGLPLPKWEIIKTREDIDKIWDQYEKPVVIKPTGLTGGHGVKVGINSKEQAYEAFGYAQKAVNSKNRKPWQKKIMIQEQAEGDENGADYRLLVIDGKLQVCTKRIPAFVTGNGKDSIEELINKENEDPRRDVNNPAHILKPIKIDHPLKTFLKEQDLTLESVPTKEERVYVRNVASMSRGGITEDYTDQVSPEIKTIVESIASTMHVFAMGIDIICKDISKPLTKDNGAILEVNTMPESYLNFFPIIGQERTEAIDYYIQQLLKNCNTQKIVIIGQTENDIPTLLRSKKVIDKNADVGFYKNNKIIINNCEFSSNIKTWKAIEALKINSLLNTIILQYRDLDEIRNHGLGFDRIDRLYVTQEIKENKEAMKTLKKYKRQGYITKIKIIK
jgi:D-alanine-D-alanine ligase-like ATP-grasp enzyme